MEENKDPEALTAIRAAKLFQCSLCSSAFTRNSSRHRHYRKVHKILNTLKHPVDVPMEELGANGEQQVLPESVNITPQLYYSCLICAKSFTARANRDKHFRKIHNRYENAKKEPEQNLFPNYQCDICDEEFLDETIFLNHKSLHSTNLLRMEQNDSVYECEICESEFSTNRSRARHYWLVHNGAKTLEQAEEMSHTEPKSPPPPTVEDTEDETKNKFPCSICSNRFASNFSRFRHIQTIHNDVIVLTKGPRVHKRRRAGRNGKIAYPCDICGCVFTRNFTRERHYQNIHNGKRHYIEVHSGVEKSKSVVVKSHQTCYPCIICKKVYFASNESRERHYKNVHNGAKLVSTIDTREKQTPKGNKINYPCVICNVVFTRKQHLDRHIRGAHHGNRSLRIEKGCSGIRPASVVIIDNGFQCDACGEVFDSHLFLVRHKSTKPQDNNGELQAHAAGLSALQVITDDSQSVVVTYVNDDANSGHIGSVNDAYGGHIGSVNDANGGHIGAVNEQLPAVGLAVKNEFVERVVIDDDEPGKSFFVKGEPEESFSVEGEPEESFSVEDEPVESFVSLNEPNVSFIVPNEPIESFTIEDDPIKSLSVAVEPEENFIVNRTPKESTRKPNRKRSSVKRRTSAKRSKPGAFACDICHSIFTTNGSRKRHLEVIHNKDSNTFTCGICENLVFYTKGCRRRHYRTIHNINFNDEEEEEEEALPLKLKPLKTKQRTRFPCAICICTFTRKTTRERHYRNIHDGARTVEEVEKRGMMLSVANMRHVCDICENVFDSKLMLESHKSSEHATNKDIPNAGYFAVAESNDQIDAEVAVKQENNTDLLLHIVKEEYEVYENSFTQEIVSDNVNNGEDSNDEPANNAYLDTTAKWQYM